MQTSGLGMHLYTERVRSGIWSSTTRQGGDLINPLGHENIIRFHSSMGAIICLLNVNLLSKINDANLIIEMENLMNPHPSVQ